MLLLLNGPPGVGTSTVARHYADDHSLALILEVDELRMQLGRWATTDESKSVARELALALAQAHLERGLDVVVPQFLHARSDWTATCDAQAFRVHRPDGTEVHHEPWTNMDCAA